MSEKTKESGAQRERTKGVFESFSANVMAMNLTQLVMHGKDSLFFFASGWKLRKSYFCP
jgi:hypothetical protein